MELTLLHDENNAASCAFLAIFGESGQVITSHDECVAFMPNLQGYPLVVYKGQALFNPASMAEVETWQHGIDNPPAQVLGPVMSKTTFATRMITNEERPAILRAIAADTTLTLQSAKEVYDGADDVDLTFQPLILYIHALQAAGVFTPERVAQILSGTPVV